MAKFWRASGSESGSGSGLRRSAAARQAEVRVCALPGGEAGAEEVKEIMDESDLDADEAAEMGM